MDLKAVKTKLAAFSSRQSFKLCLGLWVLIGLVDLLGLLIFGKIFHEFRGILNFAALLILVTEIEETFFLWGIFVLIPNSIFLFLLSFKFHVFGAFLREMFFGTTSIALVQGFHNLFYSKFISENVYNSLKKDLKEHQQNSFQSILHFSLIGCTKERNKVLKQAYHVLENSFHTDKSLIFIADYSNNCLIPAYKPGEQPSSKIAPILVSPDFWTKHAIAPDKGLMGVISGNSRPETLKRLIPGAELDAIAVMPLSSEGKVIGLLTVIKQRPENRKYLDPGLFATFGYVLASALDNCEAHELKVKLLDTANQEKNQIQTAFGKYVSSSVVEELVNSNDMAVLGGKKRKVSIMMVDLRGFTLLANQIQIEQLVKILNYWLEKASQLILGSYGTIDKFMGDGIMVIFGAPIEKPDDVLRSVYTAFRLQVKFNEFFQEVSPLLGQRPLGLGISIATGEAIVGNFGSSNRMEYTAIGDVVNLASRLEKLAGAGEIVVDQNTFSQLPQFRFKYTQYDDVQVKGLGNQSIFKLHEVLRTNAQ